MFISYFQALMPSSCHKKNAHLKNVDIKYVCIYTFKFMNHWIAEVDHIRCKHDLYDQDNRVILQP